MDDIIIISNLNDFIFCPASIYFHKLYEVRTILHTMLFNIVDAILQVYGFDTYYGVFHKCFYMRKSLVCDLMEPIRPVVDYQVRKSINLGQCKENDFEVINNRWCLKYKSNPQYIQFLMNAILEYKDDIFLYIQQSYRFFMKRKSVSEIPVFIIH